MSSIVQFEVVNATRIELLTSTKQFGSVKPKFHREFFHQHVMSFLMKEQHTILFEDVVIFPVIPTAKRTLCVLLCFRTSLSCIHTTIVSMALSQNNNR